MGISQEKLGDLLDLTFQQVQKYEKGTNRVGAGRLLEISTILKVPIEYFYGNLAEGNRSSHPEEKIAFEALSTVDGQRLARAFSAIENLQLRRKVVELVESMSEL